MASAGWRRLWYRDGQVRSGWRILLFLLLFALLSWTATAVLRPLLPPVFAGGGAVWATALSLAAALVAGWLLLARLDGRPPGALGFAWTSHTLREALSGLALAAASLAVVVGALALAGAVVYRPQAGAAVGYAAALADDFVVLAVAAAAEEALFRGYPFQVLVQGIGAAPATLLASFAFGLAHIGNPNIGAFALINLVLAGILLSVAYLRTRSLWFASAVHLGWNWTMASVLDLPVSGLEFFDTPLYEPMTAGPAWVTGGAFGPEGGLAGTAALVLALVAVVRLPGLREAPEIRARRPLIDA